MTGEPTREEVLAWMARTGGGPPEAVAYFWPTVDDDERARIRSRVGMWRLRASKRREAPAPQPVHQGCQVDHDDERARVEREESAAAMGTSDRARWLLEWAMGAVQLAAERGDVRGLAQVAKVARELSDALDDAIAKEARDRGVTSGLADLDAKIQAAERVRAALRAHQERASHPSANRERML